VLVDDSRTVNLEHGILMPFAEVVIPPISGLVYSRVVFQLLVLQTLVSTQSGAVLLLDMP